MSSKNRDIARQVMSEMGRKGGKAAARRLSKEERIARARKAGKARQEKARKEGQQ